MQNIFVCNDITWNFIKPHDELQPQVMNIFIGIMQNKLYVRQPMQCVTDSHQASLVFYVKFKTFC